MDCVYFLHSTDLDVKRRHNIQVLTGWGGGLWMRPQDALILQYQMKYRLEVLKLAATGFPGNISSHVLPSGKS